MNTQVKIIYKMKELNLYRIWQIMNKASEAQDKMHEKDLYVYLLNTRSYYVPSDFENFLNYFNFKIEKEYIEVFNYDPIPYESDNNDDVFYIPKKLLSMTDEELDVWIEDKIERELKRIERDKIAEKERIKADIDRLNKQLEKYD